MQRSTFLLTALILCWAAPLQASPYYEGCNALTGSSATLIVPVSALESSAVPLAPGSEFALFTPNGTCAGHAVWEGGALALAVWEDDPLTSLKDGFVDGETLRMAAWDPISSTEYADLLPVFDPTYVDEPVFASDAIYLVSALGASTHNDPSNAALAFGLEPNFPNPFVDATTIRYSVAREANVSISVYDLLGQRIAEIVNERQPAGGYEVTFRPPASLSSGTYLYRIAADTYTEHHRMVLVR